MTRMTEREASERLWAFEARHQLFDARLDGWSPWRVLRFQLFNKLVDLPYAPIGGTRVLARTFQAMVAAAVLAVILLRNRRHDGVIKSFTSALRERADGHFRDIYFDRLLDTGLDCLKLETRGSSQFDQNRRRALRPSHLDADVFRLLGRLMAAIFPRRELDGFFAGLEQKLRAELAIEMSAADMRRIVSSLWWQIRLYELLLRRTRARFAAVVDTCEYALSVACRRSGVRFIELQHGIFNKHHPDVVPGDAPGSVSELLLPEIVAVFGEYWREQLRGTAIERVSIAAVGNGQIDRAREMRISRAAENGRRRLLVTSQGLDTARFAAWLTRMINSAPSYLEYELTIKLHPAYDDPARPEFASLAQLPNVTVITGAAYPDTYQLMAETDIHLSIASTCHFEAVGLQIPTIIIPLAGHELLIDLVDGVAVHLAREPSDAWAVPVSPVPAVIAARFYVPGFAENLRRLVA
jgi:hypothetical protein